MDGPIFCTPCVQTVPFFDDRSSYGHAVIGFVAAQLPGWAQAAVSVGYIFYQMSETEQLAAKVGDLGEYATGFLLSKTVERFR